MSMTSWAEKEVEIACGRERELSGNKDEWDYGCACYESALKALKSLSEDGHSGYSMSITKHILNRLIEGKPLTPIEDGDDVWNDRLSRRDNYRTFQCKRMPSLFKYVYEDGTVKYTDINRVVCVNFDDHSNCWSNGFVRNIIDYLYPIKMPYMPESKEYKVYCKEYLTDRKNGDLDTIGVLYVKLPDGTVEDIYRYFKDVPNGWDEIDAYEYMRRVDMHNEREEKEMQHA